MRLDQASVELSDLITKVKSGRLDIQPDFQRGQVWNDAKKKRLIDTILREWYVPAIHIVVNDEMGSDEILDGQQRVRSIIEFVNDEIAIDGFIEPEDESIWQLNGLYYSQLPDRVRIKFNRYTLNTIRLRDFSPEEPGELFFRLNQNTSLTAAEQRNALIGEPRNQVRKLANTLEHSMSRSPIGFSNARMNYDDVIARLALSYENKDLRQKITAANLEQRYRSDTPFDYEIYDRVEKSIERLAAAIGNSTYSFRLNKASLYSWLLFATSPYIDIFKSHYMASMFMNHFESERYTGADFDDESFEGKRRKKFEVVEPRISRPINREWVTCLQIFNDRASSRVNDVSSIILRDAALHIGCYNFLDDINESIFVADQAVSVFHEMLRRMTDFSGDISTRASLEYRLADEWGQFRALR